MRVKAGVDLNGVMPETLRGIADADEVSRALGYGDLIVTSVKDGKHRHKSKHYDGLAFDFRTRHLTRVEARTLVDAVRARLGDARWDVVYEDPSPRRRDDGEHGHAEIDPK